MKLPPLFSKYLRNEFDLKMPSSRRKAAQVHTIGGWFGNIILILQGILLIPINLHYLGAELYGYWLATGGVLAWLAMLDVGGGAVARQRCASAYARGDFTAVVRYFWHGALINFCLFSVLGVLLLIIAPHVPDFINSHDENSSTLINCFLIAGLGSIFHLSKQYLRELSSSVQRVVLPVVADIVGLCVGLFISVYGLMVLDWGLYSLAIASVFRGMVPFAINLLVDLRLLKSAGERNEWSRLVFSDYLFTTPAILSAKVSGSFVTQLPVILLTKWYGPEMTVAYTVTMRLLQISSRFINQPLSALYASSAHYFSDQTITDATKSVLFRKIGRVFLMSTGVAFSTYVLLNAGFINLWVGKEQFLSNTFTWLAALAILLQLRSAMYSTLIGAFGALNKSGFTACAEKCLLGLLMFLLIRSLGALGIPLSIIITSVILQFPYMRMLAKENVQIAHSLTLLQWFWLPIGCVFWLFSYLAPSFVMETWVAYLLRSAGIGLVALASLVILLPEEANPAKKLFARMRHT